MGSQYRIKDLEKMTGIKPRTIHYYIKERLIPPAAGAGGGAFYNDEHVMRLNLIKEMQRSHLKLSGIREALDGMSVSEMEQLYERAIKGKVSWDSNSLENWIVDTDNPVHPNRTISQDQDSPSDQDENQQPQRNIGKDDSYLKDLKRSALPDSSWERFHVIDGVEINVRSDIMEKYKPAVIWWVEYLRSRI